MRVEDLVRVAGGLKRSAYAESADLARFEMNGSQKGPGDRLELNLADAMNEIRRLMCHCATETF